MILHKLKRFILKHLLLLLVKVVAVGNCRWKFMELICLPEVGGAGRHSSHYLHLHYLFILVLFLVGFLQVVGFSGCRDKTSTHSIISAS